MPRIINAIMASGFMLIILVAAPLQANDDNPLSRAYHFPELFEVMAEESQQALGSDGATPLDMAELAEWRAELRALYDPVRMEARFIKTLEDTLADQPDVRSDALDFARSDLGARILQLELSARQALLDTEIDDLAREALLRARNAAPGDTSARRLARVRARIDANDLIELNVSLGMNTSFAYYMGMFREGAVFGLNTEDLLQLVQAQEYDIRRDVTDWIESYFLMAYRPLTDEELEAYIAYCQTAKGDAFNQAMFRAFDDLFVELSGAVGQALGWRLRGERL